MKSVWDAEYFFQDTTKTTCQRQYYNSSLVGNSRLYSWGTAELLNILVYYKHQTDIAYSERECSAWSLPLCASNVLSN